MFKLIDYIKFAARPAPWGGGPPMMDLCKQAKNNGVKVLLSGDCVDEFTAGYSHSSSSLEKFNGDFSLADKLCNVKYLSRGKKFIDFQHANSCYKKVEKECNKCHSYCENSSS